MLFSFYLRLKQLNVNQNLKIILIIFMPVTCISCYEFIRYLPNYKFVISKISSENIITNKISFQAPEITQYLIIILVII